MDPFSNSILCYFKVNVMLFILDVAQSMNLHYIDLSLPVSSNYFSHISHIMK